MQLPNAFIAFTLADMNLWAAAVNPSQIEMTDEQYAHYANLCRANRKDFNGIPIVFLDAPQSKSA